jgi:hypothetical protein
MSSPATTIVLISGAVTFTGEWYWNHEIDWKVPLATILLAAGAEGLSAVDKNGATVLSCLVLLAALSTPFKGHTAFGMISGVLSGAGKGAATLKPAQSTRVQ